MKKTKYLIPCIGAIAAMSPLYCICACANKQSDQKTLPGIKVDKALSYQYFSTFTINKTNKNSLFQIKVDDKAYSIDQHNSLFNAQYISDTNCDKVLFQPTIQDDLTHKYNISYTVDNQQLFNETYLIKNGSKVVLNIEEDKHYFSVFHDTITIAATDAATGSPFYDMTWKYQLMDKEATSYLEYFSNSNKENKTTLTLVKTDIKKPTSVWVFANTADESVGVEIPILNFSIPTITVSSGSAELKTTTASTFSIDVDGSLSGFNLTASWNIYSASGTLLNIDTRSSQVKSVPINSDTVNTRTARSENYGTAFEWLFNSTECGCFNGIKGISNDLLKMKLHNDQFIPNFGGIWVEALLFSPDGNTLLATSPKLYMPYSSPTKDLVLNTKNEIDLYYAGVDETSTEFIYSPYLPSKNYKYEIDTISDASGVHVNYFGYKDQYNLQEGTDEELPEGSKIIPTTSYQIGEYLFGKGQENIYLTTEGDKTTLTAKLQNSLFLKVQDPTDDSNERRNIDLYIKINVKNDKGETITAFPLKLSILNKNRIIDINDKAALKGKTYTYENNKWVKTDDPNVIDLWEVQYKMQGRWTADKKYKNELYIPKTIDHNPITEITRTIHPDYYFAPKDAEAGTEESTLSAAPKSFQDFKSTIKYISFQKGFSTLTKITGCFECDNTNTRFVNTLSRQDLYDDSEAGIKKWLDCNDIISYLKLFSSASRSVKKYFYGAFSNLSHLRSVDLSSLSGLTTVSAFSFYEAGTEAGNKAIGSIEFPNSIKKIDDFAFAGCKTIKKIVFSPISTEEWSKLPDPEEYLKVSIGNFAFANEKIGTHEDSYLSSVSTPGSTTEKALYRNKKITTFGVGAFANQTKLTTIDLSYCTKMYLQAFTSCYELKLIDFSQNEGKSGFIFDSDHIYNSESETEYSVSLSKYYFSCQKPDQTTKIPLSVLFDGQTLFIDKDKQGNYMPLTGDGSSATLILYNENIKFVNFSADYKIYNQSRSLEFEKLNIFNASPTGDIDFSTDGKGIESEHKAQSLTELTLSGNTVPLGGPSTSEHKISGTCNLKRITFNGTTFKSVDPEKYTGSFFGEDTINSATLINKLYSMTFICSAQGESEKDDAYASKILTNHFPTTKINDNQSGIINFAAFSKNKILTINIKMSPGKNDGTLVEGTTPFDVVYSHLYVGENDGKIFGLMWGYEQTGEVTQKIFSKRTQYNRNDPNTNINCILI